MVNIEILQELHRYSLLFEERWGREVDYVGMPSHISQERLLLILRYAVETGDSVLVSAQKVRDIISEYHNYLEEQHALREQEIESGYIFEKPCPLCGNSVKYNKTGNSYTYTCSTKNCFASTCREI